jgi:hypothetical protein
MSLSNWSKNSLLELVAAKSARQSMDPLLVFITNEVFP